VRRKICGIRFAKVVLGFKSSNFKKPVQRLQRSVPRLFFSPAIVLSSVNPSNFVFREVDVVIFSLISCEPLKFAAANFFDKIKPDYSILWTTNPSFYFGLDVFGFGLYKLYIGNLKNQSTVSIMSQMSVTACGRQKVSVLQAGLLRAYIRVLKEFYKLIYDRKVAKKIASSSVLRIIAKFTKLTGRFKYANVFRADSKYA